MRKNLAVLSGLICAVLLLIGCGGGGSDGSPVSPGVWTPTDTSTFSPFVPDSGSVYYSVPLADQNLDPNGESACAPTSLAMAIAYYRGGDPQAMVGRLFVEAGTNPAFGATDAGVASAAWTEGFTEARVYKTTAPLIEGVSSLVLDAAWLHAQLTAGHLVIAHVAQHAVLAVGFEPDGDIIYADPNGGEVTRKTWADFDAWWRYSGSTRSAITIQ